MLMRHALCERDSAQNVQVGRAAKLTQILQLLSVTRQ